MPKPLLTALLTACAAVVLAADQSSLSKTAAANEYFVYFGTYTRTASKGIYAYRFSPSTGQLTSMGLAAESADPSFVAVHPSGRYLYVTNEQQGSGTVSAFSIDPVAGKLTFLNKVSARGDGPCHISVDRSGAVVLVANYGTGNVAAFPIQKDGRLGEAASTVQHQGASVNQARQRGPHAHFIVPSSDNRFALAVDLGIDKILSYRLDPAKPALVPSDPPFATVPPGSGPRHLVFHPTNRFVYVNGELTSSVSTFSYEAKTGAMTLLNTVSTLPSGYSGTSTTAEIQIDPTGRFLYVSNRGLDSVAMLTIDQKTGLPTLAEQFPTEGKTPRHFTFDPSGAYLFAGNQNSNSVIVYRADAKTGRLTRSQLLTDVPEPVCIVFVPVTAK